MGIPKNRRLSGAGACALFLLSTSGSYAATPAASPTPATAPADATERYKNLELFQKVLHFVETNYVVEVKNSELIHGAIQGMLTSLDPHSNFLPPDVFREMKSETSGVFGGLGIEVGVQEGVLTVIAPVEDSPAWKAGLKPGDRLVKIDGESTKGITLTEAINKMRGKPGSSITLSIFRDGFERIRDVKIQRADIQIRSVKKEELEDGFGYVRLTSFNERAAKDIKAAIEALEKKRKLRGLILDLRMNPGGLLEQAVDVTSLFVPDGIVVSTMGRNESQKEVKHVRKQLGPRTDFPMAVLVDSSTASAAEIVAAALQDHKRAVIMGQTSFGKGSVQTVIDLGQEMGLKLTIARYYSPTGRSIQEKGVQPDVFLDEYDGRLLEKAKVKRETTREKDLRGHIVNPEGPTKSKGSESKEYSDEELRSLDKRKKAEAAGEEENGEGMEPLRFEPKRDYWVQQAVNTLRSYEVFKSIEKK